MMIKYLTTLLTLICLFNSLHARKTNHSSIKIFKKDQIFILCEIVLPKKYNGLLTVDEFQEMLTKKAYPEGFGKFGIDIDIQKGAEKIPAKTLVTIINALCDEIRSYKVHSSNICIFIDYNWQEGIKQKVYSTRIQKEIQESCLNSRVGILECYIKKSKVLLTFNDIYNQPENKLMTIDEFISLYKKYRNRKTSPFLGSYMRISIEEGKESVTAQDFIRIINTINGLGFKAVTAVFTPDKPFIEYDAILGQGHFVDQEPTGISF